MKFRKTFGLLLASLLFSGCGLLFVGVALPEAFSQNDNLGLRGTIMDDMGKPVDQVLAYPDRQYYLWHADGNYMEYLKDKPVAVDHEFNIPTRRAHQIVFTFKKAGFRDQAVTVDLEGVKTPGSGYINGNGWPQDSAVSVVMVPSDRQIPRLAWLDTVVDFTDETKQPVVDLAQASTLGPRTGSGGSGGNRQSINGYGVRVLELGPEVPAGMLYADIARQPLKTSGPSREVDPLDIHMPARMTFKISMNGGFVLFTPSPGSDVLHQMSQAPESGYVPAIVLEEPQLKAMRDTSKQLVTERNLFFYFRAPAAGTGEMRYGKGILNWATAGKGDALALRFVLIMQPDGTRNVMTAGT